MSECQAGTRGLPRKRNNHPNHDVASPLDQEKENQEDQLLWFPFLIPSLLPSFPSLRCSLACLFALTLLSLSVSEQLQPNYQNRKKKKTTLCVMLTLLSSLSLPISILSQLD